MSLSINHHGVGSPAPPHSGTVISEKTEGCTDNRCPFLLPSHQLLCRLSNVLGIALLPFLKAGSQGQSDSGQDLKALFQTSHFGK